MQNSKFTLDWTNDKLKKFYCENNNYRIVINNPNNKKAIIFFSGNGLYYPDSHEVFDDIVLKKDRYEWETVASGEDIRGCYGMVIFVRDIFKSFYIKGINSNISSIDSMIDFFRDITKGYEVVTVGNSAGGYIATIIGYYLNASVIFNFGGQWNISGETCPFVKEASEKEKEYYSIVKLANKNNMWFWSANNRFDIEQSIFLGDVEKVTSWAIKSQYHGDLLLFPCYEKVLQLSCKDLLELHEKYQDKLISQRYIAREFLRGGELMKACFNDVSRKHKSIQLIRKMLKKVVS